MFLAPYLALFLTFVLLPIVLGLWISLHDWDFTLPGKPFPNNEPGPSLYCAVIVKTVDAQTRAKTGINELLRD